MKIFIGSDHAGYELKKALKRFLATGKNEVEDCGAFSYNETDDYPDFIKPVAEKTIENPGSYGIILGGSGEGEAIVANRTRGVRAVVYYGGPIDIVKISREHNDANVLSLGARFLEPKEAIRAVDVWLQTKFSEDERHLRRIKKIDL